MDIEGIQKELEDVEKEIKEKLPNYTELDNPAGVQELINTTRATLLRLIFLRNSIRPMVKEVDRVVDRIQGVVATRLRKAMSASSPLIPRISKFVPLAFGPSDNELGIAPIKGVEKFYDVSDDELIKEVVFRGDVITDVAPKSFIQIQDEIEEVLRRIQDQIDFLTSVRSDTPTIYGILKLEAQLSTD